MPQYCCVPLCSSRTSGHKFPSQTNSEDLYKKWIVAVKRVDPVSKRLWQPGKYDRVCSNHFTPTDYQNLTMKTFLHNDDLIV